MSGPLVLLNAPGPQGPQGIQGPMGPPGAQGPAGSALAVSGTGFVHWSGTASAPDAVARAVNLGTIDVTGFLPANMLAAGTASQLLQTVGTTATWVNASLTVVGGVTPGTPGQVYITNSSTVSAWTSLVSVELTHGRFTAGGTGSDYKAIIGPLTGNETSAAGIWLLATATSPTNANYVAYSDGTTFYINAPSAAGDLGFLLGGSYVAYFKNSSSRYFLGGSFISGPFIFDWSTATTPYLQSGTSVTALGVGTNKASAALNLYADANIQILNLTAPASTIAQIFGGGGISTYRIGTQLAGAKVEIYADNIAKVWTYNVTASFLESGYIGLNNSGATYPTSGQIRATGATNIIGGYSNGTSYVALSQDNASGLYVGSNNAFGANYTNIYLAATTAIDFVNNASTSIFYFTQLATSPHLLQFYDVLNAYSLSMRAQASDLATNSLTIQGQYAYGSATGANRVSGPIYLDIGPPTNGGTTENWVQVQRNGSSLVWLGVGNVAPTYGQIGFAPPTAGVWALQGNTSVTYLNANSQIYFSVGGSTFVGTMTVNGAQLFSSTTNFGGGTGVLGITNRTTAPTSNPTGGGILYAESGALKWRGSNGTITTIAPA